MRDTWNVEQYEKFKRERFQPGYDTMALVKPKPAMRVVDLGCGTGELTRELHDKLGAFETIGIDSSGAMLDKAESFATPGLVFRLGSIENFRGDREFDLVFSNAALQWVPGHEDLFERIVRALKPGGQIAIQIPKNGSHPSQTVAFELEQEEPFKAFAPNRIERNVLPPEGCAALLDKLGLADIEVKMNVYLHYLESRESVLEWMKGTFLTDYQKSMSAPIYERFYAEYQKRLMERLDDTHPFLFTFNRILMHARLPG